MMHKSDGPVLVAHDLTERGDEALRQGARWAKARDLPLAVCHAIPDPIRLAPLFPQESVGVTTAMVEATRRAIETTGLRSRRIADRDDIEVVVDAGSAHAVIVEQAEQLEASLVVVGPAREGVLNRLLGTAGEQVVRHATTDVLIARPSTQTGPVVVASDLTEHSMLAMRIGAEEAKLRGLPLLAVHCLELGHHVLSAFDASAVLDEETLKAIRDAATRTLEGQLGRLDGGGKAVIVEGRVAGAVERLVEQEAASLIVVGTHGHTGIRRFALGSDAAAIARHAPCSVMVVRGDGQEGADD